MASQQEKAGTSSQRPSFFGLPAGLRFLSRVGGQFWGGALFGGGLGLLLGYVLVELINPPRNTFQWAIGLPALASFLIGVTIARRAVECSRNQKERTAEPISTG